MRRLLAIAFVVLMCCCATAYADPVIRVEIHAGVVNLRLDGSYPGAWYRVFRAGGAVVEFAPLSTSNVLCTGDCIVQDAAALPGRSYQYRFDMLLPSGALASYGPYLVRIPDRTLGALLSPNPGGGPGRVELSIPGAAVDGRVSADVRIIDLQGRSVRTLLHGDVGRGVTSIAWDGRGDGGRALPGGIYFLSLHSALGHSTSRIIRLP